MQLYGKIIRHIKILFCMKDVNHLKPLELFFYIAKFLYKSVGKLKKRPFFSRKKRGSLLKKKFFKNDWIYNYLKIIVFNLVNFYIFKHIKAIW